MARTAIDPRELERLDTEPLVSLVIDTPRLCGTCGDSALIVNGVESWCAKHWLIRCGAIEQEVCPCPGCRLKRWGGRNDG